MDITRANILSVIRKCPKLAELADSADTRLILRGGIMPKSVFYAQFPPGSERSKIMRELIASLVESNRIIESPQYFRANPNDRIRPIATNYDVEKPYNLPARSKINATISRRDRLALWYAAANHNLSGSQGDSTAIFLLLKFWRIPKINRAWRKWITFQKVAPYTGKLPKDAA